jgi:ABC-type lipoprotein release transport system permease subunit
MRLIDKQTNIMEFTLSSLLRRKGKNISVVVVYTLVVFFVASAIFFANSIREEALLVLRNAPEIVVQRLVAGRHEPIPLDYVKTLREMEGVRSVKPRLWGYYYDPTSGANFTLVVSEDLAKDPGMVVIGSGVARNVVDNENRAMPFRATDGSFIFLRIKGVLASELELVSSDIVLMNETDFKGLFNYHQDYATDLILTANNPLEASTIAAAITRLIPESRPILRDEILATYDAFLGWRGGLVNVILSGAILAFVILVSDKATGSSSEESREIGILKALGWETSDVVLMKFWEGSMVSLSAFCLGILLAYLHVFIGSSIVFEPSLKGWAVLYPQFKLTPFIRVYHVAAIFFLTVVPYMLVTVVPFWKTATIDPDSVMRR